MRKIGQIFRFLVPVIALAALVVFLVGAGRRERATVEKNKAIVMRCLEVWNKGDMAVADEIYADNFIRHQDDIPGGIIRGREPFKQYVMACRIAWPDFHVTIKDMIGEGDMVAIRVLINCTFTGAVEGWPPPNGKEMAFECLELIRFAGGKYAEQWTFVQDLTLFSQMGMKLVPA